MMQLMLFACLFFSLPGNTLEPIILPGMWERRNVKDEVNARYGETSRDAYFNPRKKAEFESRAAGVLLANVEPYEKAVARVSKNILKQIEKMEKAGQNRDELLLRLHDIHSTDFGRLTDSITDREEFLGTIEEILGHGKAPIAVQLYLHQRFVNEILTLAGDKVPECKVKRVDNNIPVFEFPVGIMAPSDAFSVVHGMAADASALNYVPMYRRSMDHEVIDESCEFVQLARIKHDMPLATGTYLPALTLASGIGSFIPCAADRKAYARALLAVWVGTGTASVHEIMTGLQQAGWVNYSPGDYKTVFSPELLNHPDVRDSENE